jgi:hypothetical protein
MLLRTPPAGVDNRYRMKISYDAFKSRKPLVHLLWPSEQNKKMEEINHPNSFPDRNDDLVRSDHTAGKSQKPGCGEILTFQPLLLTLTREAPNWATLCTCRSDLEFHALPILLLMLLL